MVILWIVNFFSYFCPVKITETMNPGKNRCKYLKEVRQRIADENGIPLQQRECTFKGECSGTCPFCEAELHYLETELQKRRKLGKAVAVAGIALSSVMMSSCYTPSQCTPSGDGLIGWSPPSFVTSNDSTDLSTQRAEYEGHFSSVRGNVSADGPTVIVDGTRIRSDAAMMAAKFPEEYGSPIQWLRNRIVRDYYEYLANEQFDDAAISFVVNIDGSVSDVELVNMPVTGSEQDFAFLNEVRRQMMAMPLWEPATRDGEPVAASYNIYIREIRPER